MQIIKSLYSSLLNRTLQVHGTYVAFFSVGFFFRLSDGKLLLDPKGWEAMVKGGYGMSNFDEAVRKDVGEFIVLGKAIAPAGKAVRQLPVQVRVGSIEKRLIVSGRRDWESVTGTLGQPGEFVVQDIGYEYTYGGSVFTENPVGIGAEVKTLVSEFSGQPLPQVEYPGDPMVARNRPVKPASFSQVQVAWPQRQKYAGTYDERYLRNDMPGFARDLDWRFFQIAAPDQWNQGYWKTDEAFEIHHMNEKMPLIKGRLPGVVARCFVNKVDEGESCLSEIPLQLDTVWLCPNDDLGWVLFRGSTGTDSLFTENITAVLCALENANDARRPLAYYENEYRLRSDPNERFKYLMYEAPLLPDGFTPDLSELLGEEMAGEINTFADAMKLHAEAQKKVAAAQFPEGLNARPNTETPPLVAGLDEAKIQALIDKAFPPLKDAAGKVVGIDMPHMDLRALDELKAYFRDVQQAGKADMLLQLKTQRAQLAQQPATEITIAMMASLDEAIDAVQTGPKLTRPTLSTQQIALQEFIEQSRQRVAKLIAAGQATKEQLDKLETDYVEMEKKLAFAALSIMQTYRDGAHLSARSTSPHPGQEDGKRKELIARHSKGLSCKGMDLAFCDLSNLDLSGIDLSGAFLENVVIHDTKLTGANLENAVMAYSDIMNADFSGANLVGANLGSATIKNVAFLDTRTDAIILAQSALEQCTFRQCLLSKKLDGMLDTRLHSCSFSQCDMTGLTLNANTLEYCRFDQCVLSDANLIKVNAKHAVFNECMLNATNLIECDLQFATFNRCSMKNARFLAGSRLQRATFTHSDISESNFRECQADFAVFTSTTAHLTDFSGAQLKNCIFDKINSHQMQMTGAQLADSSFRRANLFGVSLMQADIRRCNFFEANLYSANFLNATLGNNEFVGAQLGNTILKDWRPA